MSIIRGVTRGGGVGGCLTPQSLAEIHSSGKSQKKSGKMTERFTRVQLCVCQIYCEQWERKLQTFHDVADVAFQNRFIFLTTCKWRKTHRTYSKMKKMQNLLQYTMSGEHLEDLIVLAALTGFQSQTKVKAPFQLRVFHTNMYTRKS